MAGNRLGNGGSRPGGSGRFSWVLRRRFWLYGAVLLVLLLWRFLPDLRARLDRLGQEEAFPRRLTLSGLDLAPVLIPRLADAYGRLYPDEEIRVMRGGTRQALEDLFNGRADVAFLSRPMTEEETAVVRAIGDTALAFPIALGAIAVLVPIGTEIDSLPVEQIRRWIRDARSGVRPERAEAVHLYAPDPNLGLWTALTRQLGLSDSAGEGVVWLAGDREVAVAVGRDRSGIGFASMLALPEDLDRLGVRAIRVTGSPEELAAIPGESEVATGSYPLYHYLYVACRPQGGVLASGFVSFLQSGKGQRLVAREGFLPARQVPREIQLSREPVPRSS